MIYFVTNNTYYDTSINKALFPDIKVLREQEGLELFFKLLGHKRILAVDLEATGLDAYTTTPLLYGIGTKQIQFAFDWTVDCSSVFKHIVKYKVVTLGHNLKYDIKLIKTNYNIMLTRLYDTMIAEQRIWMKSGYRFGYADLVGRYLKKTIIKSIRNEFIDADIKSFKLSPSHLYYLKGDLVDLFDIRHIQRQHMRNFKMEFLVYGVEFPLISIIAEAELEGFTLNVDKWLARVNREKEELFQVQLDLDEEVRELRDYVSVNELYKKIDPKYSLGGNKYNQLRVRNPDYDIFKSDGTTTMLGLFGEPLTHRDVTGLKKKVNLNPNSVSYNAKKEIVYIFACLEQPMITPHETFLVPQLNSTGKLIGAVNDFSIKEDLLQKYLLQKPDTIMKRFIELCIKHSKLEKAISTYGENFIQKLNPITGKIHTVFRQCDADTGRFQSGGGKKENDKYNAQNIPRDITYRECFTVDTSRYSVMTADYSGAELIVMASHAQDFRLIELSKGDMHSYLATKSWRNIYGFRAKQLLNLFSKNAKHKTDALIKEYQKYVELYKTFTVTKEAPKGYRTAFKGMGFGTIYGMYPKKAGATLNIIPDEGRVVIDTIKAELPRTFAMVEQASADAERQGYVILNSRTNSRAWFPNLIRQLRGDINKQTHFLDISGELSAARNIRIQGTQADFVKEASVVLHKFLVKNNIDSRMLSWVHDEIVVRLPKYLDGKSQQWIDFISYNPKFTLTSPTTGKDYDNLEEVIRDIMESVANRYLVNVEIQVEAAVEDNWIK